MTRMFAMEQAQHFELVSTIGMLLQAAFTGGQASGTNIRRILENFQESLGFSRWSNDKRALSGRPRAKTDAELLDHLTKLTTKKGR